MKLKEKEFKQIRFYFEFRESISMIEIDGSSNESFGFET
jgi:hypothetical protein